MRQRAYIRPMTRTITVAALQLPLPGPVEPNIEAVSALVEEAAAKGAQVILPPELFEGPYFCQVEDEELFATARPTAEHPSVIAMQRSEKPRVGKEGVSTDRSRRSPQHKK